MEEVKRQGLLQGSTRRPKEPSLQQRATDCLVLEHLQASGYEYSASVFVPESAQSEAKLSAGDALRALQIPPHVLHGDVVARSAPRRLVLYGLWNGNPKSALCR